MDSQKHEESWMDRFNSVKIISANDEKNEAEMQDINNAKKLIDFINNSNSEIVKLLKLKIDVSKKLVQAISDENFEEAASLRDELKEIDKNFKEV